jgi:hypothetical protein
MNPMLIDNSAAVGGLPAPVWFIELFKWLGFTLHAVPMNLWYAGILVALILSVKGSEQGSRFAARLMSQMPIIIAMGINLGIVPLLFIQVGFAQVFYPATILMAWFWFSIIAMLLPAYYGVYIYAFGLAEQGEAMAGWKRAAGWTAAILFPVIGFIFANALGLMENIKAWPDLIEQHGYSGAALGTALNVADWRLWPRWLLMFGLALTTTAAWVAWDSAWFAGRESPEYRKWAKGFAWKLYTLGFAWFLVVGAWYSFTWSKDVQETMFQSVWLVLTLVTAAAPALVWLLLWLGSRREGDLGRGWASLIALGQFAVLGINAAGRQVVQHIEINPSYKITEQAVDAQWLPMAIFLGSFVVGLAVIAWMVYQVWKVSAEPDAA